MTLLFRALILGYGTAALAGLGFASAAFDPWVAVPTAWLGGAVLSLALAGIGVWSLNPASSLSVSYSRSQSANPPSHTA